MKKKLHLKAKHFINEKKWYQIVKNVEKIEKK